MVKEFRIIGDEIHYMGELFAKITMKPSVIRDNAEDQLELANIELDGHDSVGDKIHAMKAEIARTVAGNISMLVAEWAKKSEDDEISPEDAATEIDNIIETTKEDELLKE